MRASARSLLALAPLLALSACNSGLFGLISATSDSGSTTVPTTVSDLDVSDSKNSPAEIQFTLAGEPVDTVHIEYLPPAGGATGYVSIATLGAGDVNISSSGAANQFDWDFAGELGTDFVEGLTVRVRLNNGAIATTDGTTSVGNSPPVIAPFSFPQTEVAGVVGMLFTVADTNDTVSLLVEVNADADNAFPEGSWEPALPDLGEVLLPFVAEESGTTVSFHWNVVGQYGPLDSQVKIRVTAVDTADPGEQPLQHQVEAGSLLSVDNNLPPEVTLNVSSFTSSGDRRRGIVVPYTVSDAEGDTPDLVFQWTLEGEPFVDLPDDDVLIEEILADPALSAQFRIATPFPLPIAGLARSTGEADTVELPELASSQSHLLQYAGQSAGDLNGALDGFELELLRSSRIPGPLAASWLANPLDGPVAALPTAEPTTAYVLDRAGGMSWRVREIDLATGAVLASVASGAGFPDAMAMERGGGALLVAAHDFDVRVSRIDLDTLAVHTILDGAGALGGETVRGLASVGSEMALATLGDELLRLNYSDLLAPTAGTVLDGLATPWGVVVDPVRSNRVYLAERDFAGGGRVVSLDLDTLATRTLIVASPGLPNPESLAIERGSRLLVLTDETAFDGTKELRALQLGSTVVSVLTTDLPESATGLVVGPDDLRLLALPSTSDLAAGGGVAQRRTIVGYDATRRVATVDADFAPPISTGSSAQPWRVLPPALLTLEPGVPLTAAFVWDSSDLPGGQGNALLRLTARDADSSVFEHDGGKSILSGFGAGLLTVGSPGTTVAPQLVRTADLDGDGDLDLLSPSFATSTVTVFFQTGAGVFDPAAALILGGAGTTDGLGFVATADLNGDGKVDIVTANAGVFEGPNGSLTVFFQTGSGVFDPVPSLTLTAEPMESPTVVAAADLNGDGDVDLVTSNNDSTLKVYFAAGAGVFDQVPSLVLGGEGIADFPRGVATADMDGDGDLDIVSANTGSNTLTVFFQTGAGVFGSVPSVVLGGPGTTLGAGSVKATDLDGDGDVDLISSSIITNQIILFFQTGAGDFDPVPVILGGPATTPFPFEATAADVDGDGRVDIVSANLGNDSITVFFQKGSGGFDPEPSLVLGSTATTDGPNAVAVADLDGDGNTDIISANVFSNSLTVFFQSGAGAFDPVPSQTLGSSLTIGYPAGVAAADLDGDGDLDLVSANLGLEPVTSSSLSVFFQTEPGVFEPLPSLTLGEPATFFGDPATLAGAADVVAADLDGDGDIDLASANGFVVDAENLIGVIEATDTLTVFFQTAPGVFATLPSHTLGGTATTDGAMGLAAADLNGDGELDLVSANSGSGTLTVFFQTGAGVFDPVPSLTLGDVATNQGAAQVVAADLDGDGDLDLVSANGFDAIILPEPENPKQPGSITEGVDTLTVFFQTDTGIFDPVPSLTLGGPATTDGAVDLTAADMDGDGDLDIVCANEHSNSITVFFQTAPGVFGPVPSLTLDYPSPVDGPQSVTAADMDRDGDLDLVCASPGGGLPGAADNSAVTVFFQISVGVFESETFILSGPSTVITAVPVGVTVADLDGDGDADIVSGNGSSSNLSVFYGTHEP